VFTRESGSRIRKMAMVSKSGLTELLTRDSGRIISHMELVSIPSLMEILLRAAGEKAKRMEMPLTCRRDNKIKLEMCIEENGVMARSMVKESKTGLMEQNLKACICSTKSMERALFF
jgi:hypothetical protein